MPLPIGGWYLLLVAVASGAIAVLWTTFSPQTHIEEHKPEPRDRFERVRSSMPDLIAEMARDVMENPEVRWRVALDSQSMFPNVSQKHFTYYASDHSSLHAKFEVLEMNGYLKDVTPGNRWEPGKHAIYAMTEEFIERLRKT